MKTPTDGCRSPLLFLCASCVSLSLAAPAFSQSAAPASAPASEAPTAAAGGLYVTPRNGQTADQQAADRYTCYTWAVKESKFDPSEMAGTGSAGAAGLAQYRRAMTACLTGRGYSVSPAAAPSAVPPPPAESATPVKYYPLSKPTELKYRPFEFQIDGGYTVTTGATEHNLSGGPNAGIGIAWFPTAALPLGLRVDGSWSRFGMKNSLLNVDYPGYTSGRENIYGGDADLQLDLAHRSSRSKLYLLGGVGWYRMQTEVRQVAYQSGSICGWYYCYPGYVPELVGERNSTTTWQKSWNAGIGWELAIAPGTSFFIEARYRHFLQQSSQMSFVPINVGLRF